jgi:SAM-dependent methyltransferase
MLVQKLLRRIPPARNLYQALRRCWRHARFLKEYRLFRAATRVKKQRVSLHWRDRFPCLDDRTTKTCFEPHYTYHPAWAARRLAEIRPARHIDISSSLPFATLVSAFIPVDFYDYRPAGLQLTGLTSGHADLTQLPFPDQSLPSVSCMHVVEHVGLGRYGDPLDPDGDLKAMAELQRVVAPGGHLLFVVPVGKPRICFNAHRIYSYDHILAAFPELSLSQFALIPDDPASEGLMVDADPRLVARQRFACGCFHFQRRA